MREEQVWLVTGSSRGFGRIWTEAALARGDKVAATARDPSALDALVASYGDRVLPLPLDVTNREAAFAAVERVTERFGRLDVVVNNAGFCLSGAIEEVSERDARAVIDTNVLGVLWVTQAALPVMRRQRSGRILSVSSYAGVISFATVGMYVASKWALEGLMETLRQEVASYGIKVTLIEPLAYVTDFGKPTSMRFSTPMDAYDGLRQQLRTTSHHIDFADPRSTVDAIFAIADAAEPPLHVFLGKPPLTMIRGAYDARLADWEKWAEVSSSA
jgi:NAD(P)-dependent dehydrogenase (short-subunit alcohol dehydrogenase family)